MGLKIGADVTNWVELLMIELVVDRALKLQVT